MTQPGNNPFQSPETRWTEHDQRNADWDRLEAMADFYGNVVLAFLALSVTGVGLLCVAQILVS
ncbi:hypothetical protein C5Y93_18560 [Blastopirellula marina]|uniref:Uncharacterized protein n=1 Tax=Blastopirellula marina TaxID=124 RepID=A0A2S8GJC1_9BACT|nr:hypothetical protein C5Y93_18560 [Blastopirellula marina]